MEHQRAVILAFLVLLLLGVGTAFVVKNWNEHTQRFRTGLPVPQSILPEELLDVSQIVPSGPPQRPPTRPEDPLLAGSASGTVEVMVIGDFQCPFCKDQAQAVKDALVLLGTQRARQLRVIWRDLPLVNQHPRAQAAAAAAECAGRQGKFAAMHDALFFKAQELSDAEFFTFADELRLNTNEFLTCLRDPAIPFRLQRDLEDLRGYAIVSVPLIFIEETPLDGFTDARTLAALLERRLGYPTP
jgi:protein-disulfide isomerase